MDNDFNIPSNIDWRQLKENERYMDDPCIRIFCSMHKQAYKLQLRARAPLIKNEFRREQPDPKNLMATAHMSREDLIQLRNNIDQLIKHS